MDCNKAKTLIKEICSYNNIQESDIIKIPNIYEKGSNCYKAVDWYNTTCNNNQSNRTNFSTK